MSEIPDLGIYRSDGDEPLSEDEVIEISSSDYLICKPLDGIVPDPPLTYVWLKRGSAPGPRYIYYENQGDGTNR